MAGTTSIEDILSSVVDETAVSALIGSLESKLAAGNTASTSSPLDSSSVGSNHVGEIVGTVGELPGPGLQNNAGRDGQSAAPTAAGPGSAITATVSPQLGAGSSKTQESLASSVLGNASESHLGGEKKMGTESAMGKNINNSASNANTPNTAGSLQNRSRPNTPTTCVRIITLPAGMGAGNAVTTASTIHTRSMKNTVLSSARTLAKTVGTTSITTVQGQSVLQSGAITAVTSSAMSSGLSLSTGLGVIKKEIQTTQENAQSFVTLSANSSIREQLSSGAKQPIMTNVVSTTANTTNTPAQIVLRSTPMSTFQSSNVGKTNASSPSVVTVASTIASQMKVISTASGPQVQQVRLSSPQVIAPRTPGGPVQLRLPHGASLPPGVMLINKDGNIHAVVNSSIASSSQLQQLQSGILPGGVAFRQPGSPAIQRPGSQPTSIIHTAGGLRQNMGQLSNQLKGRTQVVVGNPPLTFLSKAGTLGSSSVTMSGQGLQSTAARGTSSPGIPQAGNQPQQIPMSQSAMENVKKCRNFLTTLIKLASNGNQPAETVKNVKELVQNLIDGKTEPEEFTLKLQRELRSSPQPYLIPFLKKSLPLLRQTLQKGGSMPIQGLSAPTVTAAQTSISSASGTLSAIAASQPTLVSTLATSNRTATLNLTHQQLQQLSQHHLANRNKQLNATQLQTFAQKAKTTASTTSSKTSSPSQSSSPRSSKSSSHSSKSSSKSSSSSKKDKVKDHSASGFKDDDDINDVTSMAGVNLSEESARILATNADFIGTQLRSIKEEKFLFSAPLQAKVNNICVKHGIQEASTELMELVSHAAQERLRGLVEKLGVIAMHRMEVYRNDSRYEVTSEVKSQLKFFEQLDSLERKRREEQERELLIRAAKSRSKQEDPEQARLKQKAKEMQQMELEQIRQQQANMTALAAIGPRKKRKLDSPTPGSVSGPSSSFLDSGSPGGSSVVSQFRRVKRVNFRDLIFLMEQEQELKKSQFFFKMFLK